MAEGITSLPSELQKVTAIALLGYSYIPLSIPYGSGYILKSSVNNGMEVTGGGGFVRANGKIGSGWRMAIPYWQSYVGVCAPGEWYNIEVGIFNNMRKSYLKIDGQLLFEAANVLQYKNYSDGIKLFNCYSPISVSTMFKDTKLYDIGGNLVGDYLVCIRRSDSKCGVYDLLTKTFIEAIGTATPIY